MTTPDGYRAHIHRLTERTLEALEQSGFDGLFIHSGRPVAKSRFDDQDWPFCPVPAFLHWANIPWPDCAIVVSPAGVQLGVVRTHSYWEAPPQPDWAHLRAGLECVELTKADQFARMMGGGRWAFVGHDPDVARALGFDPEDINPQALVHRLHEARVHKTDYEIACLAEANRIGARGHRVVAETFERGVRSELALHLSFLAATGQDDAEAPYKNIVALGPHGSILHHVSYRDVPGARSLLVDACARCQGYNADITRTIVEHHESPGRNGRADAQRFGELIDRMDALQQDVCATIRVGENYESLHDHAHVLIGDLLVEAGLVSCSAEAAVSDGITRTFFPHGLGHALGIQVHDVGHRNREPQSRNPHLRNTRTIEPHQVFTIEPGLYFIDALLEALRPQPAGQQVDWKSVEALKSFGGIRIEDNVVVLPEGGGRSIRNLTREAFAAR